MYFALILISLLQIMVNASWLTIYSKTAHTKDKNFPKAHKSCISVLNIKRDFY